MRPAVRETWIADRWSRGSGPLHSLDARVKLAVLIVYLLAIASSTVWNQTAFAGYAAILAAGMAASRLPLSALGARLLFLLPFSGIFALIAWLSGDTPRALALVEKSLLSGLGVVVMVATTPLEEIVRALEFFRVPRSLVLVMQFLYRYLFVIADQAHRMRMAAACRQGNRAGRRPRFQAAAGIVGVLFARSWQRADHVYRAMAARGFQGTFPAMNPARFRVADVVFLCSSVVAALTVRLML